MKRFFHLPGYAALTALLVFGLIGPLLTGCAHVHLATTCPNNSTGIGFGLSGSTVGNTALSMIGGVATKAGVLAKLGASAQVQNTMDYTYVPIFGSDAGSLNCTMPVPASTTIVTVPSGPPSPTIMQ